MYDFHDFGLTFFLHNVFFVLLKMSKNVFWVVARLPQRLKSTFFEIFSNGAARNVDFSLWGNCATTQNTFFDIFKSTKTHFGEKKVRPKSWKSHIVKRRHCNIAVVWCTKLHLADHLRHATSLNFCQVSRDIGIALGLNREFSNKCQGSTVQHCSGLFGFLK